MTSELTVRFLTPSDPNCHLAFMTLLTPCLLEPADCGTLLRLSIKPNHRPAQSFTLWYHYLSTDCHNSANAMINASKPKLLPSRDLFLCKNQELHESFVRQTCCLKLNETSSCFPSWARSPLAISKSNLSFRELRFTYSYWLAPTSPAKTSLSSLCVNIIFVISIINCPLLVLYMLVLSLIKMSSLNIGIKEQNS